MQGVLVTVEIYRFVDGEIDVRLDGSHVVCVYRHEISITPGAANLSKVLARALDELELCARQPGGWQHRCTYRDGRRAVEAHAAATASRPPQPWRHRRSDRSFELLQARLCP